MGEFVPGELGFLQVWLVGGPLDGTTYNDMPVFPGYPLAKPPFQSRATSSPDTRGAMRSGSTVDGITTSSR